MELPESNIRMPAVLVPSFQKLISTEEGKDAMKRIRVECGVCRVTRFYSIHRGITRIAGVVACEACRQFYQRFNKQPFSIYCSKGGRCFAQEEFHKTTSKCKACWVAEILNRCPVAEGVYNRFQAFLQDEIKERMTGHPLLPQDVAASERGALGLEMFKNNDWVDVTEKGDGTGEYNEDDGFEPDLGMEFEAEEEMVDEPIIRGSPDTVEASASTSVTNTSSKGRGRRAKRLEGRDDMDPDDRDGPADGTTVVMATLIEGLHVNNQFKFMENFNPKNSERVRRKKKKVQYFSSTGRGKRDVQALHAGDGSLAGSGKDLCDCLQAQCPGCHFPCPKCGSGKCGVECRMNRKWYYESVEVEGTKLRWQNEFMKK